MRLGKNKLRRIIKEEFLSLLREQEEVEAVEVQGGPPEMPEDLWKLPEWRGGDPESYDPWGHYKIEAFGDMNPAIWRGAAERVKRLTAATEININWMFGLHDEQIVWVDATVDGKAASKVTDDGVEEAVIDGPLRSIIPGKADGIYAIKVNLMTYSP